MELRRLLKQNRSSILLIAAIVGFLTYFQSDMQGLPLLINIAFNTVLATIVATVMLILMKQQDWLPA